jgi:hypothetical protein
MLKVTTSGCGIQEAGILKTGKGERFAVEGRDDGVREEQQYAGGKREGEETKCLTEGQIKK